MDRMRYNDIIEELSDYDPSLKAARIGSTVTIGEIVEMAKAIERLQKAFDDDQEVLKGLEQERDAALAEVERLKSKYAHTCKCGQIFERPGFDQHTSWYDLLCPSCHQIETDKPCDVCGGSEEIMTETGSWECPACS